MWKEQTEALFFIEHLNITEIAQIVSKSRKTVSKYLNSLEQYENEMKWRKEQSNIRRKESKIKYNKVYKQKGCDFESQYDKDILKKCHIEAVTVLSHERYF